jgi:hypothetical protein
MIGSTARRERAGDRRYLSRNGSVTFSRLIFCGGPPDQQADSEEPEQAPGQASDDRRHPMIRARVPVVVCTLLSLTGWPTGLVSDLDEAVQIRADVLRVHAAFPQLDGSSVDQAIVA